MSMLLNCSSATTDLILEAAQKGDLTTVQECVQLDPSSFEATNLSLRTPLRLASGGGHLEVVKYLVSAGANLEERDSYGSTPLHQASYRGHLEVVEYLVGTGAFLEATSNMGYTPLLFASAWNRLEVVKFLVEAGADIDATGCNGDTPLSKAWHRNNLGIVKFLEEAKAHQNHVQYLSDLYRLRRIAHYRVYM